MVLEGRRTASGASQKRKVRTPKGAMPRNPGSCGRDTRGRKVERPFDGQCHRKSNRRSLFDAARVKRCGKSAPREAQATRHGKPHRVQGQIGNPGAARSRFRESETDSGYRLHRQMILSAARRRQNSAYSPSKTNSQSQLVLSIKQRCYAAGHDGYAAALPCLPINSKSCLSRCGPAGTF